MKKPYKLRDRTLAFIEDVEWMVETGECLTGAARRFSTTVPSLEARLLKQGRLDLTRALRAREEHMTPRRNRSA